MAPLPAGGSQEPKIEGGGEPLLSNRIENEWEQLRLARGGGGIEAMAISVSARKVKPEGEVGGFPGDIS